MEELTVGGIVMLVIGAVIGLVAKDLAGRVILIYKTHEDFVTSLVMFTSGMALLYLVATSKEVAGLQLAMAALSTFLLVGSYTLTALKISEYKRESNRHKENPQPPT